MITQSRYQQLLQRRFGQPSPMRSVVFPELDAAMGAQDAATKLRLGQAGLNKRAMQNSLNLAVDRNRMAKHQLNNEQNDMNAANWLNAGGMLIGLGKGVNDARYYDRMAEMMGRQTNALKRYEIPPFMGLRGPK